MSEAQQRELVKRGHSRSLWVESIENRREKCVVKCFHGTGPFARALDRRRAERERRALEALAGLGFRVPAPLRVTEGHDGVELTLTFVEAAATLFDLTRGRALWPVPRERVAVELGRLLGLARRKGVSFSDLHSKNVLVDAHGAVWLVDVGGVRLRQRALSEAEHTRNIVMIAAELREHTSSAWRLRAAAASERENGGRVTHAELADWSARARARRRVVAARAARRWLRPSSVTTRLELEPRAPRDAAAAERALSRPEFALRSCAFDEQHARTALAEGKPARIDGDSGLVRAAWLGMARLTEHALETYAPIAFLEDPTRGAERVARAVFDDHGASLTCAELARDPRRRRAAARGLGRLLGALHDRGLTLASPLDRSVAFDERGQACFTQHAVPVDAALDGDVLTLLSKWARSACPGERGRFSAAFLRAIEATPADRRIIRERLTRKPLPPREPRRRRIRAQALEGATLAANLVPHVLVRATLAAVSPLASFSRFERTTRANLELAFATEKSPREIERIARGVRRHAARQFAEWLRLANTDAESGGWIDDWVEIDPSIAILERELSRRKGALVVSAHIGNWELLAARLRRAGHPGAVVGYRRARDSSALWFERLRERYGVVNIDQASHPRAILRALDEGLVVGLLADLEVRRLAGDFVPFFGREALTMSAPAALARAARRPLIPAQCVFDARRGRYVLSFEEPLLLNTSLARRERTLDLCRRLNLVYERWIRAHPEQWAWHQPRWRTRAEEADIKPIRTAHGAKMGLGGAPAGSSLRAIDPGFSPD